MAKTHTVITSAEVLNLIDGRKVIPPPRTRKTWYNSRLVCNDDGTTMPLLHLIAEKKFGPWDPSRQRPAWLDKDWCNESMDNVQLVGVMMPREKKPGALGIPAGTPEYYRAYRAANPEKRKQWARRAYEKTRSMHAENKKLREENERLKQAGAEIAVPTEKEATMAEALFSIIGKPEDR